MPETGQNLHIKLILPIKKSKDKKIIKTTYFYNLIQGYWLKKLFRKLEEVAKSIINGTG